MIPGTELAYDSERTLHDIKHSQYLATVITYRLHIVCQVAFDLTPTLTLPESSTDSGRQMCSYVDSLVGNECSKNVRADRPSDLTV